MAKHMIMALVEDHPGVLTRVASLFRRRGFNIESLAVGTTETRGLSRMTIVVDGADAALDQARKQLAKIMEVVKVSDITEQKVVVKELAFIKVRATASTRSEIMQLVEVSRAAIVDVGADSLIVEVAGESEDIDSLITLLRSFGVKEVARTGRLAMTRGMGGILTVEDNGEIAQKRGRSTRLPSRERPNP